MIFDAHNADLFQKQTPILGRNFRQITLETDCSLVWKQTSLQTCQTVCSFEMLCVND